MNNYSLNKLLEGKGKVSIMSTLKKFLPFLKDEKKNLVISITAVTVNFALNLVAPILLGYTVDHYIQTKQYSGVLIFSGILLVIYLFSLVATYCQTWFTGKIGQNTLFKLRNNIFNKLQSLPLAFFNANKAGDLISRINNDTDKLNTFLSQGFVQFVANGFAIVGTGIFILFINWKLALASLAPALFLLIFTRIISPWIKRKNATNLKNFGGLSGEISESLDNFKVIVAFNRRDYFRQRFNDSNKLNYDSAIRAGIANNTLNPTYGLASNIAMLIVITYGIYLISIGSFTLGILISFIAYITRFYDPLRQMAAIWSSFQTALASWDRIDAILSLESDLAIIPATEEIKSDSCSLMEFKDVSFGYTEDKEILHKINFKLDPGKTYALVGPTGGGKTTTASLMARLYDPTKGTVLLHCKDIRSFEESERAKIIGFILQEPILFSGTVRENILYGNEEYQGYSNKKLSKVLNDAGLEDLISRFEDGLETKIVFGSGTMSLGQRQLIAFIRAVLRKPEILILDEATANIDTVTEQLLEEILKKLPARTTKVIIAHRLNTIENADEIFFVNAGQIKLAGSMEHAVEMLLHGKRES